MTGRRGSAHGASGKRSKVSGHSSLNIATVHWKPMWFYHQIANWHLCVLVGIDFTDMECFQHISIEIWILTNCKLRSPPHVVSSQVYDYRFINLRLLGGSNSVVGQLIDQLSCNLKKKKKEKKKDPLMSSTMTNSVIVVYLVSKNVSDFSMIFYNSCKI